MDNQSGANSANLLVSTSSDDRVRALKGDDRISGVDDNSTTSGGATKVEDGPHSSSGHVQTVALIYEAGLGRVADAPGLNYWIKQYEAGSSLHDIAERFLHSLEFTSRFGDDSTMSHTRFVTVMYQNVLGRAPDDNGLHYWVDSLSNGFSHEQALIGFANSPENVAGSNVASLVDRGGGYWDFL